MANQSLVNLLESHEIAPGEKISSKLLSTFLGFKTKYEIPAYPPTPCELLTGKVFVEGLVNDVGDMSKAYAVLSGNISDIDTSKRNIGVVDFIGSPSAIIGLCLLTEGEHRGKFVLIFKNKKSTNKLTGTTTQTIGWALPGGTVGYNDPQCGTLSQEQRKEVYSQALEREFLEECGIEISNQQLFMSAEINARFNHHCCVALCKGKQVGSQRLEDSDLSVFFANPDQAIQALKSDLAIDTFLIPHLNAYPEVIFDYFNQMMTTTN